MLSIIIRAFLIDSMSRNRSRSGVGKIRTGQTGPRIAAFWRRLKPLICLERSARRQLGSFRLPKTEGALLDQASVQSLVRSAFGVTPDRRAGSAEGGIPELVSNELRRSSTLSIYMQMALRGVSVDGITARGYSARLWKFSPPLLPVIWLC